MTDDKHTAARGLGTLGPLFRAVGRGYPVLTVLARFPFAMVVVGVLTVVVAARDSIQLGGLTAAMVGFGMVCFGPFIGAAADRYGHRPTLLVFAALNSAALGALAWIVYTPATMWLVMLSAFLIGATVPQTSPMSRTRLVSNIDRVIEPAQRPNTITAALAFESVADEMSFVLGPVVVGLLATLFSPWAPIIGAAMLTLVFVTAFAWHRTAVSVTTKTERAQTLEPARYLLRPSLLVVVLGAFGAGLCFGGMLTSLIAFMQDQGLVERAGLVYGFMALSSGVCAVAITWLPERFSPQARWLVFSGVTTVGALLFVTVTSVVGAAIALAIMGAGVGPLLVTLFNLGADRTPQGRSATVMTMINTGIMVGQAVAGAIVGLVAAASGTGVALLSPLFACAVTLTAGVINVAVTSRAAPAAHIVR